jgi:CBS domain-containing protein
VTEQIRLARQTTVEVCQRILQIEPLIVGPDDDLLVVMRRSAAQPSTRLIGVADPTTSVIVGVLPILRVVESVVARVVPESLMTDLEDIDDIARFGHAIGARTAGEAMLPPATIAPEATIAEAFRTMHRRRLSGLYVVDRKGRSTGYLDLLELAVRYVDALEADGGDPRLPGHGG